MYPVLSPREIIKRFALGSGLSVLIKVANSILAYLMLMVIARASTTEHYGTFAVAFSIGTTLALSAILGQPTVVIRYWSQWVGLGDLAKARSVLRLSMRITCAGIGAAVILVLATGLTSLMGLSSWTFGVAAGTALFTAAFGWAEYAAAGLRARGYIGLALAPRDLAWRIVVCIIFGRAIMSDQLLDAESILLMLGGALAIIVAPQIWFLRRPLSAQNDPPLTRDDRQSILRYSATMWMTSTFQLATAHGGVVIVSVYLGVEAAGAYFAADRTASLLAFVLLATNLVSGPLIAQYYHSGLREVVRKIVGLSGLSAGLAALVGMIISILLGDKILSLFDPAYGSYLPVLLILGAGQFLMAMAGPAGVLLIQTGHDRIYLILVGIGSVVSLVAQALAGIYWGVIGVAIGAAIGPIITNVAAAIFAWRINRMDTSGFSLLVDVCQDLPSGRSLRIGKKKR